MLVQKIANSLSLWGTSILNHSKLCRHDPTPVTLQACRPRHSAMHEGYMAIMHTCQQSGAPPKHPFCRLLILREGEETKHQVDRTWGIVTKYTISQTNWGKC